MVWIDSVDNGSECGGVDMGGRAGFISLIYTTTSCGLWFYGGIQLQ